MMMMEEVSISETESRYFGDLFLCCDAEKSGKVPILKATEMFRSANLSNDVIRQITCVAGIPQTAIHMSRAQFYSCLKLIAAHQAGVQPLRVELIAADVQLPLPKFSWTSSPTRPIDGRTTIEQMANGGGPTGAVAADGGPLAENATSAAGGQWRKSSSGSGRSPNLIHLAGGGGGGGGTGGAAGGGRESQTDTGNSDLPSTDSEVEHTDEMAGGGGGGGGGRGKERHRHIGLNGSPEAWSTASDSPTPTNSVTERPWAQHPTWQGLFCEEQRQLLGTEEESSDRHSSDEDPTSHGLNNSTASSGSALTSTATVDADLDAIYQITGEQRDYYLKQFRTVQPDIRGVLAGPAARIFFEKSRIPVDELRHIWQLCDVTHDNALSLAEFTAAMHLVVLRRNGIPVPPLLPAALNPVRLQRLLEAAAVATSAGVVVDPAAVAGGAVEVASSEAALAAEREAPREADLLHLDDDDDAEAEVTGVAAADCDHPAGNVATHHLDGGSRSPVLGKSATSTSASHSNSPLATATATLAAAPAMAGVTGSSLQLQADLTGGSPRSGGGGGAGAGGLLSSSNSTINSVQGATAAAAPIVTTVTTNAAAAAGGTAAGGGGDWMSQSKEWTKFTESPTSNVSSPGPKPVNFDMQRTAQAVVSDPLILHPVPVRVTPIGMIIGGGSTGAAAGAGPPSTADDDLVSTRVTAAALDSSTAELQQNNTTAGCSPPAVASGQFATSAPVAAHRDSQPGELRAIQRPQPKKVPSNVGAIPPPPQRESSCGAMDVGGLAAAADQLTGAQVAAMAVSFAGVMQQQPQPQQQQQPVQPVQQQFPAPPPPPPRPHKHARSSSLDLNKLKLNGPQPPEVPPRVSPQIVQQVSLDVGVEATSFADFTHFPDAANNQSNARHSTHQWQPQSVDMAAASSRNITASLQSSLRSSAFEVYRKPPPPITAIAANSNSTPTTTTTAAGDSQPDSSAPAAPGALPLPLNRIGTMAAGCSATGYEHRVAFINDTLRRVSFRQSERNVSDVVHHLREQNHLLMQLCSDLSEELATVQRKKEELRTRYEGASQPGNATQGGAAVTAATAAVSGGSGSSHAPLQHHHSIV